MGERIPAALVKSAHHLHAQDLTHPVIDELVELIEANSKACLDLITRTN